MSDPVQRRLAAILAADLAGYSRLMSEDEAGTRARFNALVDDVVAPAIDRHHGRLVKTMGDGLLVEFSSVVEAVQCAADVQQETAAREDGAEEDRRLWLRIGVHLGDVIIEGDDIHGDGVNIAARLEAMADPGGICVSDLVQASIRNKLDLALEDLGDQSLKNIAEPVRVYRIGLGAAPGSAAAKTDSLFRRPAVAVLPFENLSGDADQDFFVDGLTEDIITALSLWRSFPVIARNSTFAYKGKSSDIRQVGAELGARYIVEGSVRRAGNRLRVTAQLINSENGHHIWADRLDRELADIFELQDELSQRIASTIAPEVEFTKVPEARAKNPQNLDAWELVQRGFGHVFKLDRGSVDTARNYFKQAIDLDPAYANAYRGLAWSYHRELWLDPDGFNDEKTRQFLDSATRAVELDDADSGGHAILAMACLWSREHDRALAEASRAIELNPNDAHAHHVLGSALMLLGRAMEGMPSQQRAIALSPRDPRHGVWFWTIGLAYLSAHEYQQAIEWSERALQRHAANPDAHLVLASARGHLGKVGDARAAVEAYGKLLPGRADQPALIWSFKNDTDNENFFDGLRKAGLSV